jgi:hypothetical protein
MPHPSCSGEGCDGCEGRGHTLITDCPQKRFDRSVFTAMRCTRLAKKGILPVGGGLLDQSSQFCDAFDHICADEGAWKAKLKIHD